MRRERNPVSRARSLVFGRPSLDGAALPRPSPSLVGSGLEPSTGKPAPDFESGPKNAQDIAHQRLATREKYRMYRSLHRTQRLGPVSMISRWVSQEF